MLCNGYLRTADAISPVAAQAVFGSLALFVVVYTTLLFAFLFYAMRTVLREPEVEEPAERPMRVRRQACGSCWG